MDKKLIMKKTLGKSKDGKGGVMSTIANLARKAKQATSAAGEGFSKTYKSNIDADKKTLGFNDPASVGMAAVKGAIGAGVGALKSLKGSSNDNSGTAQSIGKKIKAIKLKF